jgi:fatty acid desaturase
VYGFVGIRAYVFHLQQQQQQQVLLQQHAAAAAVALGPAFATRLVFACVGTLGYGLHCYVLQQQQQVLVPVASAVHGFVGALAYALHTKRQRQQQWPQQQEQQTMASAAAKPATC